jgi:hypothetical protein
VLQLAGLKFLHAIGLLNNIKEGEGGIRYILLKYTIQTPGKGNPNINTMNTTHLVV